MVAIHLGLVLPPASSDLPGSHISTERFCAETRRATSPPLFGLAPDGVYQAALSPRRWCALTAPFHPYRSAKADSPCKKGFCTAVYFLWHFPSGHPAPVLRGILPCGVRTFLPNSKNLSDHPIHFSLYKTMSMLAKQQVRLQALKRIK